jgi:hypothetical protein
MQTSQYYFVVVFIGLIADVACLSVQLVGTSATFLQELRKDRFRQIFGYLWSLLQMLIIVVVAIYVYNTSDDINQSTKYLIIYQRAVAIFNYTFITAIVTASGYYCYKAIQEYRNAKEALRQYATTVAGNKSIVPSDPSQQFQNRYQKSRALKMPPERAMHIVMMAVLVTLNLAVTQMVNEIIGISSTFYYFDLYPGLAYPSWLLADFLQAFFGMLALIVVALCIYNMPLVTRFLAYFKKSEVADPVPIEIVQTAQV